MTGQDLWKAFRKDQSKVDEACSRLSVTPPKRFELARRVAGHAAYARNMDTHCPRVESRGGSHGRETRPKGHFSTFTKHEFWIVWLTGTRLKHAAKGIVTSNLSCPLSETTDVRQEPGLVIKVVHPWLRCAGFHHDQHVKAIHSCSTCSG